MSQMPSRILQRCFQKKRNEVVDAMIAGEHEVVYENFAAAELWLLLQNFGTSEVRYV